MTDDEEELGTDQVPADAMRSSRYPVWIQWYSGVWRTVVPKYALSICSSQTAPSPAAPLSTLCAAAALPALCAGPGPGAKSRLWGAKGQRRTTDGHLHLLLLFCPSLLSTSFLL